MKTKIIAVMILAFLLIGACGESSSTSKGNAKTRVIAEFFDNILQKGNLSAAFDLLTAEDKALLGQIPGFFDFITNRNLGNMSEEMQLARFVLDEIAPIPGNVIDYQIGEPSGEGDTLTVPVTFMVPDQDMEAFARENIGEELFDKMDGLDQSDLSLAEKKQVVHEAMLKFRSAVKGKSFPLKSQEQSFTLIKDNGSWRISIVAAGFANMLGL